MSINHFSTDIPETHYWWAQQRQQQQQRIMDPNPNYSSSSSSIPLNIPSPNFSSWPPHLYHHYHQHHPTGINNPYNPLPPQEPTSPSSSSMFPPPQNPTLSFNLNYQEDDEEQDQLPQASQQEHDQQVVDKEPMFEKPLTPSDVGKLNRLVIPKQHAEKYFPLSGDTVDKGLLLSFEDEWGKHWRFRYSYWNSSQSYVLTKGWSRYVKEKQLDAGDVVLFERHRNDGDRLFIGWRRRGESSSNSNSGVMAQGSSGGMWSRGLYSSSSSTAGNNPQPYLGANMQQQGLGPNVPYQPECLHAAGGSVAQNYGTTPKTVRLFGVNLECQLLDDESEPIPPADASSLSLNQQLYSSSQSAAYSSSNSHMDVTLSQDVNRMRNRRGSDLWM